VARRASNVSAKDAVASLCHRLGLEEPEGWSAYFELARQWSARTDLTSARTDQELAEILFLDAAFVIQSRWCPGSASLADVGAGVGAPTIPILISDATLTGVLVEPRRIRATFLRTAAGALGMAERVRVHEQRIDPSRPALNGAPFDIALSRATFSPEKWLSIGMELAQEIWVLTAGITPQTPPRLTLSRRLDYQVPSSGAPRTVLAFRRRG
jgi:16S rRNA (guanine527-N7)-methyltransferase